MMTLNEKMYGENYAKKLQSFETKLKMVKENYKGDYDIKKHLYTMETHQTKGEVKFNVDKDVPEDLKVLLLDVFNTIWK